MVKGFLCVQCGPSAERIARGDKLWRANGVPCCKRPVDAINQLDSALDALAADHTFVRAPRSMYTRRQSQSAVTVVMVAVRVVMTYAVHQNGLTHAGCVRYAYASNGRPNGARIALGSAHLDSGARSAPRAHPSSTL